MIQRYIDFESVYARMADREMARRRGLVEAEKQSRVNWTQFRATQGGVWRTRAEIAALLGCTIQTVYWEIKSHPEKSQKRRGTVLQVRAR